MASILNSLPWIAAAELLTCCVVVSCSSGGTASSDSVTPPKEPGSSTPGTPTEPPVNGEPGEPADTDLGLNPGVSPSDPPPEDPEQACEAVVQEAQPAEGGLADIIFAVDNSGSMSDEVAAVQNNLNAFSSQIASSGIDAHVVMVSAGPLGSPVQPPPPCMGDPIWCDLVYPILTGVDAIANLNGICIAPPLGAPNACPLGEDSNPAAGYLHWRQPVGSSNALGVLQSTFPGWRDMLRAAAAKTFVVITDDDNGFIPTGPEFRAWVDAEPLFQGAVWRFSGVFCLTTSSNCSQVGATYAALVSETGGVSGDLAQFLAGTVDAQFKAVFDSLAEAIVEDAVPVDCEWTIPPPPAGRQFDKNAVNVDFTNSAGSKQRIFALDDASEYDPDVGGWYYDSWDAPVKVVACPQTCAIMQADPRARVEVLFGCARERPPVLN